jgi:hypothetical protein
MALNRTIRSSIFGTAAIALSLILVAPAGAAGKTASAPLAIHASAGYRTATVRWKAPLSDGGNHILYYVVTAHPSNAKCRSTALSCTFHGLKNEKYNFTVDAVTKFGVGQSSGPSNSVKPSLPVPTTTTTNPGM